MREAPCGPLLTILLAPAERIVPLKNRAASLAAMATELSAIVAADPALTLRVDPDTYAELGGPDEASLDRAIDALRARCAVDVGSPQVSYREAVRTVVEIDHTFKRVGLFARVRLRLAPREGGFAIDPCLPGEVPPALLAAAVDSVRKAVRGGPLAGYPVGATLATLQGGAWHGTDSTPVAFAEAARHALWQGLKQAGHLLEPVMQLEAVAPEDYEGALADDFASRGEVIGHERRGDEVAVTALVALSNMLGYASDLGKLTRGTGRFTSRFSRYRPAPRGGRDEPPPAAEAALRA